jgi:hypothetical protein
VLDISFHWLAAHRGVAGNERSVPAQMRTWKIGLNHYLPTINRADDLCARAPETTHHVLSGCN